MIRRTMEFESEDELIAAEQAVAMARELKKLADATHDTTLVNLYKARLGFIFIFILFFV